MDDLLGFLCVLVVVLAVVTVVGHGLWLMIAGIVRKLNGRDVSPIAPENAATLKSDLEASIRHLNRLLNRGIIDANQHQQLLRLVRGGKPLPGRAPSATLAAPSTTPPAPSAPSTPSTVPAAPTAPMAPTEATLASQSGDVTFLDEPIDAEIVDEPAVSDRSRAAPDRQSVPTTPPVSRPSRPVTSTPPPTRPVAKPVARRPVSAQPGTTAAASAAAAGRHKPDAAAAFSSDRPAEGHPLERDYSAVREPSVARETFAALLQSFMAEKNIRWGELVSGMLIVISAIGLVISLRTTLSETVPYFAALLFLLITLGIYGAGMYTLTWWKLQTTSRGALTIALLLAPLNFLAAILLPENEDRTITDPLYLTAAGIGLGCIGWVSYSAGRALFSVRWWQISLPILAASLGQLVADRLTPGRPSLLQGAMIAALPLSGFLVGVAGYAWSAAGWIRMSAGRAGRALLLLGIATFAVLVPLGLQVSKCDSLRWGLGTISPALSIVGAMIAVTGLLIFRRVLSKELVAYQTAGIAVAITGGMAMLAAVVAAWPQPELLIAVGLANCAVLVSMAVLARLPVLHVAAIGCLAGAVLIGFHVSQGNFEGFADELPARILALVTMTRSAVVLTLLGALCAVAGFGFQTASRRDDAIWVFLGSAGLGAASVLIALFAGFGPGGDTNLATLVLALYAILALAATVFVRHPALAWSGSALLLLALLHGLWINEAVRQWMLTAGYLPQRPMLVALLLHANFAMLLAAAFGWNELSKPTEDRREVLFSAATEPLAFSGLVIATLATPAAMFVLNGHFDHHALYVLLISSVWLLATIIFRWPAAMAACQAFTTMTVVFAVAAICQRQPWGEQPLADYRHIQWQLATLAILSLAWSCGRMTLLGADTRELGVFRLRPRVDEIVLGLVVVSLVVFGIWACWPGIAAELGSDADFEKTADIGAGSWLTWLLVALAIVASLVERGSLEGLLALLVTVAVVPLFLASEFEATTTVVSALRWFFAIYALLIASVVWCRAPLTKWFGHAHWLDWRAVPYNAPTILRETGLFIGGLPVVGLTTIVVARAISDLRLGVPEPDSLFGSLSTAVSYAVPLTILVAVMMGHAVRDRSPRYALAGSLMAQYVVTLACMLSVDTAAAGFAADLLLWNTISLSIYGIVWLALSPWIEPHDREIASRDLDAISIRTLAESQLALTCAAVAACAIWAALCIFISPVQSTDFEAPLGRMGSYVAWSLALATCVWRLWYKALHFRIRVGCYFAWALVGFIAITADRYDTMGQWLAYHLMLEGSLLVAAALVLGDWITRRLWFHVVCVGSVTIVLALGAAVNDPHAPWWSVTALACLTILASVLAWRHRRQAYAYASVLLAVSAAVVFWVPALSAAPPRDLAASLFGMLNTTLSTAIVLAGWWLAIEIYFQRTRQERLDPASKGIRTHVLTGIVVTVILVAVFGFGLVVNSLARSTNATGFELSTVGGAVTVLLVGVVLGAALWERQAAFALPCLYVWVFAVAAWFFDYYSMSVRNAFLAISLLSAGQAMATGWIWRQGVRCCEIGRKLGIPDPIDGLKRTETWLPPVNSLLVATSTLAALLIVLGFEERPMRIAAGFVPLMSAVGLGSLAQSKRRLAMQFGALVLTGVAAVYLSWADIQPEWNERLILLRSIRLLIVASGMTFIYGFLVARKLSPDGDWLPVVRRMASLFGLAAMAVLGVVLALEAVFFESGQGAPVEPAEVGAVAVVLLALAAGLISLALLPGRDPFSLSESGRMGYVYAAELASVLLFVHIFLCFPHWFEGLLQPYWPYIVMGIAFAGVGVGELCKRSGIRVLAEPLQRTGAFLPLLPALGIWVFAAEETSNATLFFVVGVLYVALSILRQSLLSAAAAVLAGNLALWTLFSDSGFSFFEHPQFWLIPPALSVLIAAHLNRRRLAETQLTAIRYISILVIYLSSTGEMFIRGIGQSLWPPILLLTLSVIGVFAGIVLQIRAFLYLGASFVFLSLVSMVWHASRAIEHVWPWWAFGIGMGLAILIMFGMFEKKRPEMARLVERLRDWEK